MSKGSVWTPFALLCVAHSLGWIGLLVWDAWHGNVVWTLIDGVLVGVWDTWGRKATEG